jgi:hypothetical protein
MTLSKQICGSKATIIPAAPGNEQSARGRLFSFHLRRAAGLVLVMALILLPQAGAAALGANTDPHPLTKAEITAFLPLVCAAPSAGSEGYAVSCNALIGYPPELDVSGAAAITLSSVAYGVFTSPDGPQAFVSYTGDFESAATGGGGGILFQWKGTAWSLAGWYPGYNIDGCLSLNPAGRADMLCLNQSYGQGDHTATLSTVTIPDQWSADTDSYVNLLEADDTSRISDLNGACAPASTPEQNIATGMQGLKRSSAAGFVAEVQVTYLPEAKLAKTCASNEISPALLQSATLRLVWDGQKLHFDPALAFATLW